MDLVVPLTYDPLADEAAIYVYLESTVTGYVYLRYCALDHWEH